MMPIKKIFISHSSKDHEIAAKICDAFEKIGAICWIAPRDIPYGEEWASEITNAIISCDMLVFIFSKNSSISSHVVREINIASQNDKKITFITIDDSNLKNNSALNYYLSDVHGYIMPEKDQNMIDEFVKKIIQRSEAKSVHISENRPENQVMNETLEQAYFRLKGELLQKQSEESEKNINGVKVYGLSSFKCKLMSRIANNYINNLAKYSEKKDSKNICKTSEDTIAEEDIVPGGRHFSLSGTVADSDMVFAVHKAYDIERGKRYFKIEQLDYCEEISEESGDKKRTFFLSEPDPIGNQILLLSRISEKNILMVNIGFLDSIRKIVKISNSPIPMEYQTYKNENDYSVIIPTEKNEGFIIIDLYKMEMLEKKHYSQQDQCERYFYELSAGMTYIIIKIDTQEKEITASDLFIIGYRYFTGFLGYNKNWLTAADYFERSGTPEALYYLGLILLYDDLIGDKEEAQYYFKLAYDGGEKRAEKYL